MVQLGDFSFRTFIALNEWLSDKEACFGNGVFRPPFNCRSGMVEIAPKWRVGEGQATQSILQTGLWNYEKPTSYHSPHESEEHF